MRIRNQLSVWKLIRRGVRHGCILLLDLFSLYSEMILRSLEDKEGISVGGEEYYKHLDTVFVAKNKAKLQKILDKGVVVSEERDLTLNCKKTVIVIFSKKQVKLV